jgi:hypothetical protein
MLRSRLSRPIVVLLAGVLVALAYLYCSIPWSAAFLLIAILLTIFARLAKRVSTGILLINIAAVLFSLAIVEAYIGVKQLQGDGTRMEGTSTDGFTHADDMLGYAPNPNVSVTAKEYFGPTLLYDVVYTFDAEGLRLAPPTNATGARDCLVFFGDSVTFGEGVKNDQTFPYLIGVKTHGRYLIRNFAFSGYGPHQMLANLESPLFDRRINCKPTHFFYLAIPQHISRVAGLTSWDHHGPRFVLGANGEALRDGNFDSPAPIFGQIKSPRGVDLALSSFFTWQRFFGWGRDPGPEDLHLFLSVVRTSAQVANMEYPDSQFEVLLGDGMDEQLAAMEKGLKSAGIRVHRISDAIPDLRANWVHYILSIHDTHPNALQHERIADYLVHDLLFDAEVNKGAMN